MGGLFEGPNGKNENPRFHPILFLNFAALFFPESQQNLINPVNPAGLPLQFRHLC